MPDVRVPQKDGQITISRGGDEPTTRNVQDHIVAVAEDDLEHFLRNVEGSKLVPATGTKQKEN